MNVIKRNGSEVTLDKAKIENAIIKASNSVEEAVRLTPIQIKRINESVLYLVPSWSFTCSRRTDMVEEHIMHGAYEVVLHISHTDIQDPLFVSPTQQMTRLLSLIELNEEATGEPGPIINSTQRDYMAGEVSKDPH